MLTSNTDMKMAGAGEGGKSVPVCWMHLVEGTEGQDGVWMMERPWAATRY